jgi:hypothetical protein
MANYIQDFNLSPGDEIIVPKSDFNIIQHHALYLGFDENGTDWIIHNTAGVGVSLITADEFFGTRPHINEIRKFNGSNKARKLLVQRALSMIGKPYNFINYNCQHFASEVVTGKPISKQVERAFVGALLLIFIGAVISSK